MDMVLLQASPKGAGLQTVIMLVLLVVVFYFFLIRPQVKRQKALRKFQEGLKKGDSVLVAGGIYGKVYEVRDLDIIVEIDSNVKVRVAKNSIFATSDAPAQQPQQKS